MTEETRGKCEAADDACFAAAAGFKSKKDVCEEECRAWEPGPSLNPALRVQERLLIKIYISSRECGLAEFDFDADGSPSPEFHCIGGRVFKRNHAVKDHASGVCRIETHPINFEDETRFFTQFFDDLVQAGARLVKHDKPAIVKKDENFKLGG